MQAELRIGCCGWAEAQARYFKRFPAVEIQATFYEPPSVAVATRWKTQAPPQFQFCMKAWQLITHTPSSPTYRRLKTEISAKERDLYGNFQLTDQVLLAWERTRQIAHILDAPVIVFQCPKSFLPLRENIRNLNAFLRNIDREGRALAWEPRGDDWRPELIRELCAENDLIHCVDPFVSDSVWGDIIYWRLHGKNGYRYRYSEQDLTDLEGKLRAKAGLAGSRYVMFNNMSSKQDAQRLMDRGGVQVF